jgi:hypothetical protein
MTADPAVGAVDTFGPTPTGDSASDSSAAALAPNAVTGGPAADIGE